jgi:hypothetical protein
LFAQHPSKQCPPTIVYSAFFTYKNPKNPLKKIYIAFWIIFWDLSRSSWTFLSSLLCRESSPTVSSRQTIIYSLKKSLFMSVFIFHKSITHPYYMFPEERLVGLNQLMLWVWKTAGRPLDFSRHISFIAVSTFGKSHGKDDFGNRLWKSIKSKLKISERKKTIKHSNWRYSNKDLLQLLH